MKYGHDSVTHEILHRGLAGLVDVLHELQDMMREAIYHSNTDVVVILILRE